MEKSVTTAIRQNEIAEAWSSEGKRFQLRINADAVDQIKSEVIRGMKLLPKRGTEVGGILYGSIQQNHDGCTIEVDKVLSVTTEYRFGPSFRLSETDQKAFERAVKAWPDRTPVGWYRSNTRTAKDSTPEDKSLTTANFSAPNLFLLLRPDFTGYISASAQVAGETLHDFEFGRFSFLDQLLNEANDEPDETLAPAIFDIQGRIHTTEVATQPLPAHQTLPQSIQQPRIAPLPAIQQKSRKPLALAIAGGVAFTGIAGWFALHPLPESRTTMSPAARLPAPAPLTSVPAIPAAQAQLGLRAEYQGQSLMIRWNQESPAIQNASSAEFTLQQGSLRRTIALEPATLKTGGLMLRPTSVDLDLRLAVAGPNGGTTESLRVIGLPQAARAVKDASGIAKGLAPFAGLGKESPALPEPIITQTKPLPTRDAKQSLNETAASSTQPAATQPAATQPQATQSTANQPAANQSTPQQTLFKPPAVKESVPQGNRPVALTEPPSSVGSGGDSASALAWKGLPDLTPPAAPAPRSSGLPVPTASPVLTAAPTHTPPKPIKIVKALPPGNLNTIKGNGYSDASSGQVIEVEVAIDEHGAVTAARIVKGTGAFARLFEKNSLDAARQWRFEPARAGSQPVPSSTRLTFHFSQQTRW